VIGISLVAYVNKHVKFCCTYAWSNTVLTFQCFASDVYVVHSHIPGQWIGIGGHIPFGVFL
jgi:hypothetical protein